MRSFATKALLAVFSFGFALIALEGVLQVAWNDGEELLYEIDREALHRNRAGITKRHVHSERDGGHTVLSHYNRFGFRGPDFEEEKGDRFRVIVYGDSFIAAKYSELSSTFPVQLERRLVQVVGGRPEIEVLNGGVPGYGPDQVLRRLPAELERFRPNLVLLHIYTGNDYGDLFRNKLYRVVDGGLARNESSLSPSLRVQMILGRFKLVRYALLARKSLQAANASSRTEVPAPPPSAPQRTPTVAETSFDREYRDYLDNDTVKNLFYDATDPMSGFPEAPATIAARELMEGVLGEIVRLVEAQGAHLVVTIQPSDSDAVPSLARDLAAQFPAYDPEAKSRWLAEICTRLGIDHYTLFDDFSGGASPESLFFPDNRHWNDAGQRVAAEAVAVFLVDAGLIPEGPPNTAQDGRRRE